MSQDLTPEVAAIHAWIRDDAPVTIKMVITPKLIAALTARLDAARAEGAPAAEGARALRSEDLAYLKRLLARDLPVAHCGEGDLDRRDREAWEERHANIIAALSPPAAEGKEDVKALVYKLWGQVYDQRPPGDPKDTLREIIAALSHPAPAAEPGGDWVMVPREPTREMWAAMGNAFYGHRNRHHDAVAKEFWEAALSASPPPEPPLGEPCTLAACPPGLFLAMGAYNTLGMKSEYHTAKGAVEAYIVESGEFFWGDNPQTVERQRAQIVRPISHAAVAGWVEAQRS